METPRPECPALQKYHMGSRLSQPLVLYVNSYRLISQPSTDIVSCSTSSSDSHPLVARPTPSPRRPFPLPRPVPRCAVRFPPPRAHPLPHPTPSRRPGPWRHLATTNPTPPIGGRCWPLHCLLRLAKDTTAGRGVRQRRCVLGCCS